MAAAVDNSANYNVDEYSTTHTISAFDCSGTDPHLVHIGFNNFPSSQVTSWTVDGNDATGDIIVDSEQQGVTGIQVYSTLINDASFDIVSGTSSFKQQALVAIALSGIDQTTPDAGTPAVTSAFSKEANAAYTGTSGNMILVVITTQGTATITPKSGMTVEQEFDHGPDIGYCWVGYVLADGTSQTVGGTLDADDNWRLAIFEIAAAVDATLGKSIQVKQAVHRASSY